MFQLFNGVCQLIDRFHSMSIQQTCNMAIGGKVPAFSAYKPFLHILHIYKSENFQNQHRRILIRNTCQAIVYSACILSMAIFLMSDVKHCLSYNLHVAQIALPLGILVGVSQLIITYISIRMKDDLIDEVIANLNKIITKRE